MHDAATAAPATGRSPNTPHETHELVLTTIRDHAESLLRVARRHSLCADDANDAYQRAVEIFLRHADRLDPERAYRWLHTVCKHEAMAVRRQRQRIVGGDEVDFDAIEARTAPSPEDQAISSERVARSAEALRRLKPQEVRALWLRAEGRSYQAICEETGWTYTKVNRCLAEGRASFLATYAGIEAGEECRRLAPLLSAMVDGEASAEQLVELRPHLRHCGACRAAVRELHESSRPLTLVLPAIGVAAFRGDGSDGAPTALLHRAAHAVGRAIDALAHGLHGRAASVAIRGQELADTVSAGKLAALAASAAAVAGGGAAVIDAGAGRGHDRPRARAAHHARHTARAAPPAALVHEQRPRAGAPTLRNAPSRPAARHMSKPARSAAEPQPRPATTRRTPSSQPPASAHAARPPGEFGFETP
jgi:RNA polymerase sigma factor (sigma-70 family)